MQSDDVLDDHSVARAAAGAASQRLKQLRATGLEEAELRAAGDREAQQAIVETLAKLRPDDIILSEEAKDDPRRLGSQRVWIVDPLDGTREYGERDRSDWSVHVALVSSCRVVAATVDLPALDQTFSMDRFPARVRRGGGDAGGHAASADRRQPHQTALAGAVPGREVGGGCRAHGFCRCEDQRRTEG